MFVLRGIADGCRRVSGVILLERKRGSKGQIPATVMRPFGCASVLAREVAYSWIFFALCSQMLWVKAMDNDMYPTGSSVYMKVLLPEIDVVTFDDLKPVLKHNILATAMGTKYMPHIRDYDIRESMEDGNDEGMLVSIMVDFSQDDDTPASLLTSKVIQEPTSVFPPKEVRKIA